MPKYLNSPYLILAFLISMPCLSQESITYKGIPIMSCEEITLLDKGTKLNKLNSNNKPQVFTFAYNRFISRLDSLVELSYRRHTEKLTQEIVKNIFPEIILQENQESKTWTYNEVYKKSFVQIWNKYRKTSGRKKYIKFIATESEYTYQLVVEISSYVLPDRRKPNTILRVYIIDAQANNLIYYDSCSYDCDSRNDVAFVKSLSYVLGKIKENFE